MREPIRSAADEPPRREPLRLEGAEIGLADGLRIVRRRDAWILEAESPGILVNGVEASEAIVAPGDVITCGDHVWQLEGPPSDPARPVRRSRAGRPRQKILLLLLVCVAGGTLVWALSRPAEAPATALPSIAAPGDEAAGPLPSPEAPEPPAERTLAGPEEIRNRLRVAEELYAARLARPGNLYLAIDHWEQVRHSLTGSNDPRLREIVAGRLVVARAELDARLAELRRRAITAERLDRAEVRQAALHAILRVMPDPAHPDHRWAADALETEPAATPPATTRRSLFQ